MSYAEDCREAMAAGTMLDPMPADWVSLRDLALEIGGSSAVPWVLGAGEHGPLALIRMAGGGIYGRTKFDRNFASCVAPQDAARLREFLGEQWTILQAHREESRKMRRQLADMRARNRSRIRDEAAMEADRLQQPISDPLWPVVVVNPVFRARNDLFSHLVSADALPSEIYRRRGPEIVLARSGFRVKTWGGRMGSRPILFQFSGGSVEDDLQAHGSKSNEFVARLSEEDWEMLAALTADTTRPLFISKGATNP